VARNAVKTHLLHIFAKLCVDDRTAAVTAAIERGMLRL
jgi:DNA-binding NarL/FixJ family response regulator